MNIEIANRLVKLRKENGLSQEELADKLGISRQAVSKWERAEASPDTDNLICLAKLYNVSLDTLLFNEESIEEIVAENSDQNEESKTKEKVVINEKGIHVEDEDSVVDITSNGIRLVDEDGNEIEFPRRKKLSVFIESVLIIVAVIGYVLMGFFLNTWKTAWILFLIPEIIASISRCIEKKKANQFNIAIFCVYIYFLVCNIHPGQSANIWHPMWVIFLAIPLFYIVVNPFKKHSVEICSEEAKFSNDKDEESDD